MNRFSSANRAAFNPDMPSLSKEIRNHLGERLDCFLHAGPSESSPLIIIGHGVTGNKDRPFLVALAEALSENGFSALRISYAGNGASEGSFEASTISKQVEELGAVIDAVVGAFPAAEITCVGHSMGAAVGVLRASRDTRIRQLVSLAGMAHTAAFAAREFGGVKPGAGVMWDKPECPLSQTFIDDMQKVQTVATAARAVDVPWLFVHGLADDVVPMKDSRDLHAVARGPKRLETIAEADHVFGGNSTLLMARAVVNWLKRDADI
jgi:alpha/beta superfamily hydrolase